MTAPEQNRQLGLSAARGVLWTGGGQAIKQVVQVATSITLARLLLPQDFGLLGMAMIFIVVAQLFADFGIGAAIVQSQTQSGTVLSSSFWANLGIASMLALLITLCSPLIAAFYNNPDLAPLVAVASLTMVLAGTAAVPQAILSRDMRFADIAKAQVIGSLTGSIAAVTLAWNDFGVWSLIAQPIIGSSVTLTLFMVLGRWLPSMEFSLSSISQLMRFSGGVLGANLITYVQRNTDSLLIGKYLGSGPLGYYQMAYQLMLFPLQQVSSVMVRVLFPTLSQLQHDLPRLRSAYLKAISAIALITFPMMMGLFAVAEDFIIVVLGEKWLPMLPVLQILAWVGMMQSISATVGTLYLSTGAVRQMMLVAAGMTPVLIIALLIGMQWGISGVALGYGAATLASFYVTLFVAHRLVGLSMGSFHRALWRPFCSAIAMLFCVHGLSLLFPPLPPSARLAMLVGAGVVAYVIATILINRAQMRYLLEQLRAVSAKKSNP